MATEKKYKGRGKSINDLNKQLLKIRDHVWGYQDNLRDWTDRHGTEDLTAEEERRLNDDWKQYDKADNADYAYETNIKKSKKYQKILREKGEAVANATKFSRRQYTGVVG